MGDEVNPSHHRMDAKVASLRGRLGALRLHASHDSRETTAKARSAFLAKFLDEVDPDRVLPEEERLRRAAYARRAHFVRMALDREQSKRAKAPRRVEKAAEGKSAADEEVGGADPNTPAEE